jgi:hypothetical protein
MSITRYPPNTVWLGGNRTEVNDLAAAEAITPGMLVERFNSSGVIRFQAHSTSGGDGARAVATEQSMLNKGVDDNYAADDLIEVSIGARGATFWMMIPSGQNIAAGDLLESNGDGYLKKNASGVALFSALENKPNVTVVTRIRVEVV